MEVDEGRLWYGLLGQIVGYVEGFAGFLEPIVIARTTEMYYAEMTLRDERTK